MGGGEEMEALMKKGSEGGPDSRMSLEELRAKRGASQTPAQGEASQRERGRVRVRRGTRQGLKQRRKMC